MNKKIKIIIWSFNVFFLLSNSVLSQSASREKILFDQEWKFKPGDQTKAKDPAFDDASWRLLNLPHDWSIEADFDKNLASCSGYLPAGFGWYRKTFDIPKDYEGKTIIIQFDGVYCNSDVWINGKHVGRRPYGYISFYYNITPYLEYGKKNVVAVRADHRKYADTRWYSGSGIYRHVWLIVTDKVHVAQWGTLVTTPEITASEAKVLVKTVVANDLKTKKNIKLSSVIVGKDLKEIASTEKEVSLTDSLTTVSQEIKLNKPTLWDIDNPYLYSVKTKIISDNKVIDEYVTPFGVRAIKFDANKGFFLNNNNIKLKGVCLHHDGGCVGAAVPEKIWKIRLEKLKAVGCNAIRTSHNPVAPELLDLCDQMGFLVLDEAFDEWEYPKRKWVNGWNQTIALYDGYPDIFHWCETDLQDMVQRDKNHPSIIIWSIGNEVDYDNDPYGDPEGNSYSTDRPDANRMPEIASKLVSLVKSIDTSRPVTMAIANVRTSNKVGLPEVLDIAGYNYTENAYANDHTKYPNRIIFGSENSHNFSSWLAVRNNDFIAAQFLWTGIDYIGEAGKFPIHTANSGLLDLTSNEKPLYYWRQAMWSDKPMIYLAARKKKTTDHASVDPMSRLAGFLNSAEEKGHWNYNNGDSIIVMAFTNCPEAELFVNQKSYGKKKLEPTNSCIWWIVPYESGEVKALTKGKDGKVQVSLLKTVSGPVKIVLKPDALKLKADAMDVALVEVQLMDKNNNRAMLANNAITFEISGEGKIIGVDNADPTCLDNYKLPKRNAFNGRCIVVVQITNKKGKIMLTAKSEGLPDASVEMTAE